MSATGTRSLGLTDSSTPNSVPSSLGGAKRRSLAGIGVSACPCSAVSLVTTNGPSSSSAHALRNHEHLCDLWRPLQTIESHTVSAPGALRFPVVARKPWSAEMAWTSLRSASRLAKSEPTLSVWSLRRFLSASCVVVVVVVSASSSEHRGGEVSSR